MDEKREAQQQTAEAAEAPETAEARETELVAEQLRQIRELDPRIRGMEDLLRMETAEAFRDYVYRGLSFVEAYWLANREALQKRLRRVGEASGKQHLLTTQGQGRRQAAVPPEELRLYRALLPELSDGEFRRHFNTACGRTE